MSARSANPTIHRARNSWLKATNDADTNLGFLCAKCPLDTVRALLHWRRGGMLLGATACALTFAISAIGEVVPDGRPFPGALYIGQIVLAAFMLPLCDASDLSCGAR